ncbi:MAG: hypothetical protein H8E44_15045 [Planctomycetes bacterium]|nr:hypothetical protein [Planctomycetota bacterium]MBL7039372.1 hypothetical protein [Pirellulaceae bacterium]
MPTENVVISLIVPIVAWVAGQINGLHDEQQAKAVLEAAAYPGALGPAAIALVGGPTAERAPYFTLSELQHGRLYVPVVWAHVGGGGWPYEKQELDQKVWNHLRSFRYLERLQISWCSPAQTLDADFSGFAHLKRVAISNTAFPPRDIRTLERLPQLRDAIFTKKEGMDQWLPSVGQLRNLRTLEIGGDASDQGLGNLAGLGSLESLSVVSDRITSNVVSTLAKLKKLGALTLSDARIDDEGLRQLAALKTLRALEVRGSDAISDRGVSFLEALEALESLKLDSKRVTSKSGPTLARMKHLKALLLPNTQFGDEGLRSLRDLKGLTGLDLSGTLVTNVGEELRFPELGLLYLDDTKLTDEGMRYLSRLPKLRLLTIPGTRVTNASIDTLAAMPSLMQVYAYDTQIDEASPEWLRLLETLKRRRASELATVMSRSMQKQPWIQSLMGH